MLRREMLEGGWVRKEQVEAIVEGRMAKVERRLAALEVGARYAASHAFCAFLPFGLSVDQLPTDL